MTSTYLERLIAECLTDTAWQLITAALHNAAIINYIAL